VSTENVAALQRNNAGSKLATACSAAVKAQVEARYPGAYNITLNQLPTSARKKRGRSFRSLPTIFTWVTSTSIFNTDIVD
jgi:hypothetical protein